METRATAFDSVRPLLFSIAYRMLGSVMDAEDVVQDAYLRWQEAPDADVRSSRGPTWRPSSRGSPSTAALGPGAAGDVRRALAARAARDGSRPRPLGLRRARRVPRFEAAAGQAQRLVERFTQAAGVGDMDGLLAVLAEDITLWADGGGKVPGAALRPVHGADAVARFIMGIMRRFVPAGTTVRPAEINGQQGFIAYVSGRAQAAMVFDIRGERIHTLYAVGNPDKLQNLSAAQ